MSEEQPTPFPDIKLVYPEVTRRASAISRHKKRGYFISVAAELIALIIGGIAGLGAFRFQGMFGTVSFDWFAAVAVAAFLASLMLQLIRDIRRPNTTWYTARAISESVKQLTWLYVLGGTPFPKNDDPPVAVDDRFRKRLDAIYTDLIQREKRFKNRALLHANQDPKITPSMQAIRALALPARQAYYLVKRVKDQEVWYAERSRSSEVGAFVWKALTLGVEAAGVCIAVLRLLNWIQLDLLTLVAVVAMAFTTWLQAHQHESLAQSYKHAADEMKRITADIKPPKDETEWASFVSTAEDAITRENTAWIATRQGQN